MFWEKFWSVKWGRVILWIMAALCVLCVTVATLTFLWIFVAAAVQAITGG